ncbi:hypothetical protein EDD37DRAFT_347409 [Exophiala viscosa]|uniref:uncharacterized protein n=1 Tax=Exophiala viscosa TaxID=2486360 RepID=UPI00218D2000|nr:hypothetical protein EDD37DRAFT_347409 [Exophiala viscosa]
MIKTREEMNHVPVPVPCYWPESREPPCSFAAELQTLGRHIKNDHGLQIGFGCEYCGFTHPSELVIRNHLCSAPEYEPSKTKVPKSEYAKARYYRKLYRKRNPSAYGIPKYAFWRQTFKPGNGKRKAETKAAISGKALSHEAQSGRELQSDQDADSDQESDSTQEAQSGWGAQSGQEASSNPTQHHCPKCQTAIIPYTKKGIFTHRLSAGHKTIIDLNPKQLLRNKRSRQEELPEDVFVPPSIGVDTDTDSNEDDSSEYADHDISFNQGLDCYENKKNQEKNEPTVEHILPPTLDHQTHTPLTAINQQQAQDLQRKHQEELSKLFFQCIHPKHRAKVKSILATYVMIGDSKTIIIALACADMDIDPEKTVFALRKDSGWYCQVPQCGAVYHLDYPFAIKLHLEAHGPNQWFCGESECTAPGPYGNKQQLNDHIATQHINSAYSHRAVRRVPKHEVSVSQLSSLLNLLPLPIREGTEEERYQEDYAFFEGVNKDEWDLWLKFGKMRDYARREDFDINQYYDTTMKWYQLYRPPAKLGPDLYKINFGLLTRLYIVLDAKCFEEGREIIEIYHNFCMEIGSQHRDVVLAHLRRETNSSDCGPGLRVPGFHLDGSRMAGEADVQPYNGRYQLLCPWPGCQFLGAPDRRSRMARHFVTRHLGCQWWCHEKGCESYCAYRNFWNLERHRMFCHVGASLQCGHKSCNQVLVKHWFSKAHLTEQRLRQHDEAIFNATLAGMRQTLRTTELVPASHALPTAQEYRNRFRNGSLAFFTAARRAKCERQNLEVLAVYALDISNTQYENGSTCSGFYYGRRRFVCADSVPLGIDTTRLLFVPTRMLFTVSDTCDFCVFVMSRIRRVLAERPSPISFGVSDKRLGTRNRYGLGSSITNHESFRLYTARSPLILTPMAEKYRFLKESAPYRIRIIDYETVAVHEPGLPLLPTEITVRNGSGEIIVSCIISDEGMTNAEFEDMMRSMGYTHHKSFESARRIRGPQHGPLRGPTKTSKEIVQILLDHGLGPDTFLAEWSMSAFDIRCMEVTVKAAGRSPNEILPPRSDCWLVCRDFMRALPGLSSSYTLANIVKLMNPSLVPGMRFHTSSADTLALYNVIHHFVFVYGHGGNPLLAGQSTPRVADRVD